MIIAFILITTLRTINLIHLPVFSLYRAVNTLRFGHGNRSYREIITLPSDRHTKQIYTAVKMWNCWERWQNLGKATISFITSVCPSARNNSAANGRIFVNFDTWEFFENLSRKFRFH